MSECKNCHAYHCFCCEYRDTDFVDEDFSNECLECENGSNFKLHHKMIFCPKDGHKVKPD